MTATAVRTPAELLRELVAIPSVSGDEGAAADFLVARLGEVGIDTQRLGHTVLARLARGRGSRFLLLSHLDTVPVGAGWTRAPYRAEWEHGRLYGRGANDAKASAAAMLWTVLELARNPRELAGELWLALTAQEETDNSGMRAVLAEVGAPDGAVCGEPTGLEVVRAQAGLALLEAEWKGRSCHAAHVARTEHDNALLTAAREIAALPAWLSPGAPHALLGQSTIAPTVFHAGQRHNVVPDRAKLVLDCRLAPPHTGEDARRVVAAQLPAAEVTLVSERLKPFETAADHALVCAALTCAGRTKAIGSTTLSDMALLTGIPAVKCGPGETARSHTSDEFVLAEELEAGARFYARFVPAALAALKTDNR
ncbi:MAG: M20/M25/M40 family metallo-hydrolase [Planctomycetes bacterium]|nr:M20/M25/M40 family metallo-hydrolase [Planctomycetota bacterium]